MDYSKVIEKLYFCATECTRCYDACMFDKNKDALQRCMMMDRDCADICNTTAAILERDTENADILLRLCVEICERCADECEKHQHEHCKKCAQACRECAELCHHHAEVH